MAATKYGSTKTVVDGITFDSKREANRWSELKILRAAGEVFLLERQVRYDIIINDVLVCRYIADFVYRDRNNVLIVEDAKGFKTPVYRLKKKLMLAVHGISITEV